MKSLLLEAYVKGQQELLYVVPFVAKVLESSLRSVVSSNLASILLGVVSLKQCISPFVDSKMLFNEGGKCISHLHT